MKEIHKFSIEEILNEIDSLNEMNEEEKETKYSLHQLVRLWTALYNKVRNDRSSEYRPSLDKIKTDLIKILIHYGSYLKTRLEKNNNEAEKSLKKALSIDKELPIAYYRLGFLAYKTKDYIKALDYFATAIESQKANRVKEFLMNEQQNYFANLYMCNSSLFIAEEAQGNLYSLNSERLKTELPDKPMAPFYEQINKNESILQEEAFIVLTSEDKTFCRKNEVYDISDEQSVDKLVLLFDDREISINYKEEERNIEKDPAEMLRFFLLYTDINNAAYKNDFSEIIPVSQKTGEINSNTFRKRVSRLNTTLKNIGIQEEIIESKRNETGYYYNGSIPFAIIYRSDESFLLNK